MIVSCSINGVQMSIEEIKKIKIHSEVIDRAVESVNKKLRKPAIPC